MLPDMFHFIVCYHNYYLFACRLIKCIALRFPGNSAVLLWCFDQYFHHHRSPEGERLGKRKLLKGRERAIVNQTLEPFQRQRWENF